MKLIIIMVLSSLISTAPNIRLPLCNGKVVIEKEEGNDYIMQEGFKLLKTRNWSFNWYFEYIEIVLNS